MLEAVNPVVVALVVVAVTAVVILVRSQSGGAASKKAKSALVALDPTKKIPFRAQWLDVWVSTVDHRRILIDWVSSSLIEKKELSHDTRRFRFALQTPQHILGLPIGKHMYLSAEINGEPVVRAYTPTSSDDDVGYFDLVVKVYNKAPPKFPDGGKMSQYLDQMRIGDMIDVRGPNGKFTYTGKGNLEILPGPKASPIKRHVHKFGFIAGGTGITPMLQVITAVLKEDKKDQVEMFLLFANQTESDILLRQELDDLQAKHDNFHLHYTLDRPPENWAYSSGFINADMLKKHMPAPAKDTIILMCGPPPMLKFACEPALNALGYTEDMYFAF